MALVAGLTGQIAMAKSICVKEWIWGGCAVWENTSELSDGAPASPPQQDYDAIVYKNDCARPIRTAIHYRDDNGTWITRGWWNLNQGQTAHVANTKNRTYYLYAETIEAEDVRVTFGGTEHFSQVDGFGKYGFFRRDITSAARGNWTQSFNCNTLSKLHAVALAWSGNGGWAARRSNTVAEAQHMAMNGCVANHIENCVLGATVNPGSRACLALSGVGNKLYSWVHADQGVANNTSLNECRKQNQNCQLLYSYCNE